MGLIEVSNVSKSTACGLLKKPCKPNWCSQKIEWIHGVRAFLRATINA